MGSATLLLVLSIFISGVSVIPTAEGFNCTSNATCRAIVDYVSPNTTTLLDIQTRFGVKNLRSILGVNSMPLSTSPNQTVQSKQKIRIPFHCACANGSGTSNKRPVYKVQPGDDLYHIAVDVFSRLVTYQQIQAVNHIKDANLIEKGQELWIPLPCSCDDVDGSKVVHYGHVVEAGSSVDQIASVYGTSPETLLRLNGIANAKDLQAGAVLDVPLRACNSTMNSSSLDYPLLVANGTYVFTAKNCIKCNCDAANNLTLQCEPTDIKHSEGETCPSMLCGGTGNLYIGNLTSSSSCNRTRCAYSGYTNETIFTTLVNESTCPVSDSNGSKICSSWVPLLISAHLGLLFLHLFQ